MKGYEKDRIPCQFSFHQLLHIHHHTSSEAGTIGQTVPTVPSGLSLIPPQEKKKREKKTKEGARLISSLARQHIGFK
jgi:hypothetical protein